MTFLATAAFPAGTVFLAFAEPVFLAAVFFTGAFLAGAVFPAAGAAFFSALPAGADASAVFPAGFAAVSVTSAAAFFAAFFRAFSGAFFAGVVFSSAPTAFLADLPVLLLPSGARSPTAESRRTTTRPAPLSCAVTGDLDTRPA
ncbi:hypothetical protein ACFQ3Z_25685 [Streptomyces nogalater]